MKIVYVRGGDKAAPKIAELSGMVYGTRHDYKPYAPIYMLDINWKRFEWTDYVAKVQEYQPIMAMTPDYESPAQRSNLYRCIRDLKPLVKLVMVCPKFTGALAHIPSWCVIAVSVPTRYAGFLPDFRELNSRKVHLLGGKPEVQADLIRKLCGVGAEIVSVDGSYHAMKAGYGQWFQFGKWHQIRGKTAPDNDLCLASAINISRYLRLVYETQSQPQLTGL